MTDYNPKNERIKHDYFILLTEARGRSQATVDGVCAALLRFEAYTRFKDFATFNKDQAIGFKHHLLEQKAERTGKPLSLSAVSQVLAALRDFFIWLVMQPSYRGRIKPNAVEYLRLTDKDERAARTTKPKCYPTLDEIRLAINAMPTATVLERRDRALVAFTIVTGMRDAAICGVRLKHIDMGKRAVFQDPREIKTKFSKAINTAFFLVGEDFEQIVIDWITELTDQHGFGANDPLFPKTQVRQDADKCFKPDGLAREGWANAAPIRTVFKQAFEAVGLPYFSPHRFRDTLAHYAYQVCKTPEAFKAWSQNLGHEQVMTTFTSYGHIPPERQAELVRGVGKAPEPANDDDREVQTALRVLELYDRKRQGDNPV